MNNNNNYTSPKNKYKNKQKMGSFLREGKRRTIKSDK
jgi:hypothetical protein